MTEYKLKKLYSDNDGGFIGWRVVEIRKVIRMNKMVNEEYEVADFYGKGAKDAAKFWKLHLMGKELVK